MADKPEALNTFFQEETIVRTPLVKYSIKNFTEKDQLLEEMAASSEVETCIDELENFYNNNKESCVSLYMLIILKARQGQEIDILFDKFNQIFNSVKKSAVIIYLAKEVTRYIDSLPVLNTLAVHYQNEHNDEELLDVWEKMLKQDKNNYKLPQKIGQIKEKQGNRVDGIRYYKMAFFRAMDEKDLTEVLIIWKKLIQINFEELEFFLHFGKKLVNILDEEKKLQVYRDLLEKYFDDYKNYLDECLIILKETVELDSNNAQLRSRFITLYREKYASHSHLEEFLALSGLLKPWKSIVPQIEFFEKHIRFDNDSFVHHKSFGYGKIINIEKTGGKGADPIASTKLTIDFEGKPGHSMSLRIALNSLEICEKTDLNALGIFNNEHAKEVLTGDPAAAAEALLATAGKSISTNDAKTLAVPRIIPDDQWAALWKKIKNVFTNDPRFEYKNKLYGYSKQDSSYESDLKKQFYSTKDIQVKLKCIESLVMNVADPQTDEMNNMVTHLIENIDYNESSSIPVSAFLFYINKNNAIKIPATIEKGLKDSININNISSGLDQIRSIPQKNVLLDTVLKLFPENQAEILKNCFLTPSVQGKSHIIDILEKKEKDVLTEIISQITLKKEEYLEHYLLILKQLFFSERGNPFKIPVDETYLNLLQLLSKTNRDISSQEGTGNARKIFNAISFFLFDSGNLFNYLKSDESAASREKIFDQLDQMHFLENYLKVEIKELMTKLIGD